MAAEILDAQATRIKQEQSEKKLLLDEVNKLESERDEAINEAKTPIIDFLLKESKGAYAREDLEKLDLESLKKMKVSFVDAVETSYQDILGKRQVARDSAKKPPSGMVYNIETSEWEEY